MAAYPHRVAKPAAREVRNLCPSPILAGNPFAVLQA
jgi:hypothetical protein